MIDLRSDTVTLPTPEMRAAIASAELGDDVYGADPTVNRLESRAAEITGKEAALLVSSGTMGNLIAILTHCARGDAALVGDLSHSYLYEAGGASALGGVVMHPIANTPDGALALEELNAALERPADIHFAPPALVTIENTHNRCGGAAVPASHMAEVAELVHGHSVALHLDGARIFNAAVALETSARALAAGADSLSFCFSKGLACPVGSALCGTGDFIARARRLRKMLGGGMRQAGIIAAPALLALDTMVDRLAEDHRNARALAEGLALIAGLSVQPVARRTNMVMFEVEEEEAAGATQRFAAALECRGVKIGRNAPRQFRAVTHYGVTRRDIDFTIAAAAEAAAEAIRA